jgi:hypothetical protein
MPITNKSDAVKRIEQLLSDDPELNAYLDMKTAAKLGRVRASDDDEEWYAARAKRLEKLVNKIDFSKM